MLKTDINLFMSWLDCEIEEREYSDEELTKRDIIELDILKKVEEKAHEHNIYCPTIRGITFFEELKLCFESYLNELPYFKLKNLEKENKELRSILDIYQGRIE